MSNLEEEIIYDEMCQIRQALVNEIHDNDRCDIKFIGLYYGTDNIDKVQSKALVSGTSIIRSGRDFLITQRGYKVTVYTGDNLPYRVFIKDGVVYQYTILSFVRAKSVDLGNISIESTDGKLFLGCKADCIKGLANILGTVKQLNETLSCTVMQEADIDGLQHKYKKIRKVFEASSIAIVTMESCKIEAEYVIEPFLNCEINILSVRNSEFIFSSVRGLLKHANIIYVDAKGVRLKCNMYDSMTACCNIGTMDISGSDLTMCMIKADESKGGTIGMFIANDVKINDSFKEFIKHTKIDKLSTNVPDIEKWWKETVEMQ